MDLYIVYVVFIQDREYPDEYKKGYRLARATSVAQAMDKVADYMITVENVHYIDYLEASKVID
ncbi:hypothetical protein SSP1_159 [Shigella phage SSP1]|uniref:Uncharacterized protein n=1 Tax=Shigella phage SSP1 TaxID=1983588 RepID=A0A2N9QQS2_9CAUD|nr:hypothetical protein HOS34_gp023 [Shigella phage SSP1]ASD50330.1 hypothetical protein SSP1_159 [Shigella phage SSP1]